MGEDTAWWAVAAIAFDWPLQKAVASFALDAMADVHELSLALFSFPSISFSIDST